MTICYLEVDDEITTAIGRIRSVDDGEAVIVVPPGSRIATSRINFKLLAREGHERRLNVVAVSDEPAVRALAISAGLPTYDSLAAAEHALANFREQDRRLAERTGQAPGAPGSARAPTRAIPAETLVLPGLLGEAESATSGQPATAPRPEPGAAARATAAQAPPADGDTWALPGAVRPVRVRRRWWSRGIPVAPLAVLILLALLMASIGYGAYLFLPTATIVVRPVSSEFAPQPISVVADVGVAVVDVTEEVVPAQRIDLPFSVSGAFPSTGVEVRETRASGNVRFRSENTLNDVPIPADTLVSTADGVEFVTQETVTVPRASFASGPTTVEVEVRAVRVGPRGNVEAGAITELPPALANQLITVRNPQPTTGGRRFEDSIVTQEDFDVAVATLTARLNPALQARAVDPQSIPRGLTAYAETARIAETRSEPEESAVVGRVTPTFSLTLRATGNVIAVNEALVGEVATARLRALLPAGQQIVGDEVSISHPRGRVSQDKITYSVAASALVHDAPDAAELIAAVRGKTVSEAEAILSRYGMVEISMWPEFVDRLPDQHTRISLTIAPPSAGT